jgi:hypothetical protein
MSAPARPRAVLFALLCIALGAAALAFARAPSPGPPPAPTPTGSTVAGQRADLHAARRLIGSLRRSVRDFLASYFRYELGEVAASVRRGLRATATARFAGLLLAYPVRRARGAPAAPARIRRLEVSVDPADPSRAFVGGSAVRGHAAERFAFEFTHGAAGWRASGIGE